MNRDEYRDVYLRSDHWLTIRKAALERAEHRCQVCNTTKALDVHHRTYERLGRERDADLTVLCRRCHDLFHDSREKPRKKGRKSKVKVSNLYERDPLAGASGPDPRAWHNELLPLQQSILRALRDGGLTMHQVAYVVGLPPAKTGPQMAKLRQRGYITKQGKTWKLAETAAKAA